MISQNQSLNYLVPLAIVQLESDPFVEADYFPGDLLQNLLRVSIEFWTQHPDLQRRMTAIVKEANANLDARDEIDDIKISIKRELDTFLSRMKWDAEDYDE